MRRSRRGTTLAESMIASVLLATCVVGITGALTASYQNQNYAEARRAASVAGRKLMENVAALPMDPATAGAASIADYQQTSTTTAQTTALGKLLASLGVNLIQFTTTTTTTTTPVASTTNSTISVDRRTSLSGASSATGDFAIVTVAVPARMSSTSTGSVKFKRLVTSVEAAANQVN